MLYILGNRLNQNNMLFLKKINYISENNTKELTENLV